MILLARARPAARREQTDLGSWSGDGRWNTYRRGLLCLLIAFGVLAPAAAVLRHHPTGADWFLGAASLAFVVACCTFILESADPESAAVRWTRLSVMLALAIAIFAVGHENFLAALAVAGGASGRFSVTPRPAQIAALACAITGFVVSSVYYYAGFGNAVAAVVIGPMAAFFAYSASKRMDAVNVLRRTRAELAMAAVAEERLRIARDMHDLLGHSLSLITLKAELAGRVIGTDPHRAGREIAELETVARQSLSDVRAAVAGYRQPDLAAELSAARRLLDAAGIATSITAPAEPCLPKAAEAALAWAVREGATNVVRHSRATRVAITVSSSQDFAVAEISDNGAGDDPGQSGLTARSAHGLAGRTAAAVSTTAAGGSGLAGLADRIHDLGGELAAGKTTPRGFRLRVAVPVAPQPS
jgi:two-component system sensor histidine kinase DesK